MLSVIFSIYVFIGYNRWEHNSRRAGNSCLLISKQKQQLTGRLCVWDNLMWQVSSVSVAGWRRLCGENHWEASGCRPGKSETSLRPTTSEVLVLRSNRRNHICPLTQTLTVRRPESAALSSSLEDVWRLVPSVVQRQEKANLCQQLSASLPSRPRHLVARRSVGAETRTDWLNHLRHKRPALAFIWRSLHNSVCQSLNCCAWGGIKDNPLSVQKFLLSESDQR